MERYHLNGYYRGTMHRQWHAGIWQAAHGVPDHGEGGTA